MGDLLTGLLPSARRRHLCRPAVESRGMDSNRSYPEAETLAHAVSLVYSTIAHLRSPDGCPWDRKQTAESLRSSLVEEAYETVEAIDAKDDAATAEELGDVLLLILMLARIYEEDGRFLASDVARILNEKLIRRHPHVFGDAHAGDADEVVKQWDRIKIEVEGRPGKDGLLDAVSTSLPQLSRAYKLQKRAAKVGFDWLEPEGIREKMHEELDEFCDAVDAIESDGNQVGEMGDQAQNMTTSERIEEELGDMLFSVVNLGRWHGVHPSLALRRTNEKFTRRFRLIEAQMKEEGTEMTADQLERMEELWEQAKNNERS